MAEPGVGERGRIDRAHAEGLEQGGARGLPGREVLIAGVGRHHEEGGGLRHHHETLTDVGHRLGRGLVVRLPGLLGAHRLHPRLHLILELEELAEEVGTAR